MYLLLFRASLTVLRLASIFTSYWRSSTWVTRLSRNFNLFQVVIVYWALVLRPRRPLFDLCEIDMVAFLFQVAETKLYQFILWTIHFTFFSSWKSQTGLPAKSGIPRSRWCDETVRGTRPCKRVPRIIFLTRLGVTKYWKKRFKSIVASASDRSKSGSIAAVAIPVPKIYTTEALSLHEHFLVLNEADWSPSKFR